MNDLAKVMRDCEDHLFAVKKLSYSERVLYYHLLRHSRVEGKEQIKVSKGSLASALRVGGKSVAESTVTRSIRALHERGCIQVVSVSRKGHLIRVLLPEEMPDVVPPVIEQTPINLEELDFYTGRRFITALLARENLKCFYCFRAIRPETCDLDHVQSRANGTDHSYRNIVAACCECNTMKQGSSAQDFVRALYRKGDLSRTDLADRLQALKRLSAGQLQPNLELVRAAI